MKGQFDFIDSVPLVSTHEHHSDDAVHASLDLDELFLASYVGWLGFDPGRREQFLDSVRDNSYFVWLEKALARVYSFEPPLTPANWDALSEEIRRAHADPGHHIRILRSIPYLRALQDTYWDPGGDVGHAEMFSPVYRINMFVMCHHPEMKDHNDNSPWKEKGFRPKTFGEYMELVEERVRRAREIGCVALKSALAYDRDISFSDPPRGEAERAFLKTPEEAKGYARLFGDYVMQRICEFACACEMPIQFHTGMGLLRGSSPMNLLPTIERHPRTQFVLFHDGYPWTSEVAALSHNCGNVHPDLAWLPLLSTSAAVRALIEWLEVCPSSSRIAWGGDCWTSEESFGAALAFRHVLKEALSRLVRDGMMTLSRAEEVARKLAYENAAKLYGLRTDG